MMPLFESNHSDDKGAILRKMFLVICFTNALVNLDHGIIPACTKELVNDTGISELELGLLGSLVYGGLMMGSVSAGILYQKFSSKKIIIIALTGNMISLFTFPIATNFLVLGACRVITGFCQVFLVIYFPVWVDLYGEHKRTKWLTLLQICVPLGVVLGYGMAAIMVQYLSWQVAFFTLVVMFAPCVIGFIFFEEKYMATNNHRVKENPESAEPLEQYLLTISRSGSFIANEVADWMLDAGPRDTAPASGKLSDEEDDDVNASKLSFIDDLKIVWARKVYRATMLSISALYFVVTGVQFWISDYLRSVLGVAKKDVFIAFSSISITAPVLGVIVGGTILDRIGGYTAKGSIDFALLFAVFSAACGMPVPLLDSFAGVCVFLWLTLFFGGAIMPALQGIMISSIPKSLRATGSSIAQIFQNLLGYMPAPAVYGLIVNSTGGKESRWGMITMMAWGFWAILGLTFARKARLSLHTSYMRKQYVEMADQEAEVPDKFEPRPDDVREVGKKMTVKFDNHDTLNVPMYEIPKRKSMRMKTLAKMGRGKSFKDEPENQELQRLSKAVVDYRAFNKSNLLSKDKLDNLGLMYGGRNLGGTQSKNIKEEML